MEENQTKTERQKVQKKKKMMKKNGEEIYIDVSDTIFDVSAAINGGKCSMRMMQDSDWEQKVKKQKKQKKNETKRRQRWKWKTEIIIINMLPVFVWFYSNRNHLEIILCIEPFFILS